MPEPFAESEKDRVHSWERGPSAMLRVFGGSAGDGDGITRRSFVQAGVLGLGGMALGDLLRLRESVAASAGPSRRSVILFWLSGGPGHMETWDPKPDAPDGFRGPFGAIRTNLPGVHFGELMPEQAAIMDKLSVLRTVNHGTGDHTKANHWMLTGYEGPAFNAPDAQQQRRPSLGSAVSRVRGANRPGIPAYAAVPHLRGGTDNFFHYAAYLGGGWNPFVVNSDPNSADFSVRNLTLPGDLPLDRVANRRALVADLDRARAAAEPTTRDLDSHQQAAFDLLTGPQARKAFDVASEPASV